MLKSQPAEKQIRPLMVLMISDFEFVSSRIQSADSEPKTALYHPTDTSQLAGVTENICAARRTRTSP
jgi:hypothetical protein